MMHRLRKMYSIRGDGPYGRHGILVRIVYLGLAFVCCVWQSLVRRTSAQGWIVLCFHGVRAEQAKRFEEQLQAIRGRVVSISDIGKSRAGVCLTFDDAFACLLENVMPIVQREEMPVAIFPVTDNLDDIPHWDISATHPEKRLRTMSRDEVQAISLNPLVTIGSHTASHPRLGEIGNCDIRRELEQSQASLESIIGYTPVDLALPHGSFRAHTLHIAQELGYRRIFTLEPLINRKLPDDGRLGRFSVDPDMWLVEFWLTAAGAYSFLLPLRQTLRWWKSRFRRELERPNRTMAELGTREKS